MGITRKLFGMEGDREVSLYTLTNKNGVEVQITDYAGAIVSLKVPDRDGRFTDVVCGFDGLEEYKTAPGGHGALIGRFGNRIAKGHFTLEGKEYQLYINNGENSLHGGKVGFSHKLWDSVPVDGDEPELHLTLVSPDMDENFPGELTVNVTYKLTCDNALSIHYEATTDKTTIVNLTNHTYFNLNGYASGTVHGHTLKIDADTYLPTDEGLIPTGELKAVKGTPFDFTEEKTIGRDINLPDEDLIKGNGYDHCFNFVGGESETPIPRVWLYSPETGRELTVICDSPCIQVYTGNFMDDVTPFKGGAKQGKQNAVALETQKMPDSINQPGFTDVTLRPGEKYDYTTIFKFSVR